jgi:hypothetical protein
MVCGACALLVCVITKCHSLLSQEWLLTFAVIVIIPWLPVVEPLPGPVAIAGLDAVNTSRAKPTMKVMTPLALRIGCLHVGFHSPAQ